MKSNWTLVPEHLRDGLKLYLDKGIPPGHFLTAVLENNLMEAVGRGDGKSLDGLIDLCKFIYMDTPAQCHGSPERVSDWIRQDGMRGLTE